MNSSSKLALGIILVSTAMFGMLLRIADDVAPTVDGISQASDSVASMLATIVCMAGVMFLAGSTSRKGDENE
jgi:hypothetical protein